MKSGGRVAALSSLSAFLALALVGPVVARAATCRSVITNGGWSAIGTLSTVTAFTVVPGPGDRLLTTDGEVVYSTPDGGCSWQELLRLPGVPTAQFPFAAERITSLVAPTPSDVYLALTGPHVVASHDGGVTWATVDTGLAGPSEDSEITVAPSDPDVLYLTIQESASDDDVYTNGVEVQTGTTAVVTTLYRSDDGARTWAYAGGSSSSATLYGPRGSGVAKGIGLGAIRDIAVAPDDPRRLWAAATEGIFTSADGGASWKAAVTKGELIDAMDVRAIHAPGSGTRVAVIAVDPTRGTVFTSRRGRDRTRWEIDRFPGFQTKLARYARFEPASISDSPDGTLAVTSQKGVFAYRAGGWRELSPVGLGTDGAALLDLVADPDLPSTFYARPTWVRTALWRYSGDDVWPDTPPAPRGVDDPNGPPLEGMEVLPGQIGPLTSPRPARLEPAKAIYRLEPGGSVTRRYELRLPPRPTPVDLYFLLDTSGGMGTALRALGRSSPAILSELRAEGIDVWAGLAQFRTYPYPTEEEFHFPYRRELAVSAPGRALARAFLGLDDDGSTGANLAALVHSVTAEGLDLLPPGPSEGDVQPGSDAGFRDGSLRVVVHLGWEVFATPKRGSADFRYGPETWPGPGFGEAIGALADARVQQIGVAYGYQVGIEPRERPAGLADIRRVARGTGALAARPVDCNGDHSGDLSAGRPLVCPIPVDREDLMRPAIVSLVKGLRDQERVRLAETTSSGVAAITPSAYPKVDLRSSNELAFRVTFSCPEVDPPEVADVGLAALLRGETVASATARVICAPRPARPAELPLVKPPARVLAMPAPPLPPPPPPPAGAPPAQAPAPQPQPHPNPNPNPQANPAVAVQRQTQPQLAFVHAVRDAREQLGVQYAMSALEPRSDGVAAGRFVLASGALSLLLLYAYGAVAARALGSARADRSCR